MTGREEALRGEVPVGELVAEEHADDGGDREAAEDPGLLTRRKAEAREVAENQRIPRAPDEKLQDHHQEQLEADRSVHGFADSSMRARQRPANTSSPNFS